MLKLVSSDGLSTIANLTTFDSHEKTLAILGQEALYRSLTLAGTQARGTPMKQELSELAVYIYLPNSDGTELSIVDSIDSNILLKGEVGVAVPPELGAESYENIVVKMPSGENRSISAFEPPDFPVIVIDRREVLPLSETDGSRSISVAMNEATCRWPTFLDPFWRPQPEVYCAITPSNMNSWVIFSGSHPWGEINYSGTTYSIGITIFGNAGDTSIDIQFRDMDGSYPQPSTTVDDSLGLYKGVDTSTLTSVPQLFRTNLAIADDNSYTNSTNSFTDFTLYK